LFGAPWNLEFETAYLQKYGLDLRGGETVLKNQLLFLLENKSIMIFFGFRGDLITQDPPILLIKYYHPIWKPKSIFKLKAIQRSVTNKGQDNLNDLSKGLDLSMLVTNIFVQMRCSTKELNPSKYEDFMI